MSKYLVEASSGIKWFSVSGDTFTALTAPSLTGFSNGAFSPDGAYFAAAAQGGTYALSVYSIAADAMTNIYRLAGSNGRTLDWSSDGTYIALSSNAAGEYLRIFKRVGGSVSLLSSIPQPGWALSTGIRVQWVTDKYVVVIGSGSADQIFWLERSGDTFSSISNPLSSYVTGRICQGFDVSTNGAYLAASFASTTAVSWWSYDGSSFSYIGTFGSISTSAGNMSFSPFAEYLYVASASSTTARYLYKRSGSTFSLVYTYTQSIASSTATASFSGDTVHVAILAGAASPYGAMAKLSSDVLTTITAPTLSATSTGTAAWFPSAKYATGIFRTLEGHTYDSAGSPISREVRIYRRDTGNMVAAVTSDVSTGYFGFNSFLDQEHYVVVLADDTENAVVYDHITPLSY